MRPKMHSMVSSDSSKASMETVDCEGEEVEQSDLHSFSFDEYVMDVSFQDACQKIDPHLEMFLAITLALFDYLRKSSVSGGYVVSVSGGCDSSVVVCCVVGMMRRAMRQLGVEGFLGVLRREDLWQSICVQKEQNMSSLLSQERYVIGELLTCLYQRSKYSSEATETAALQLCQELGATFHVVDIQPLVDSYIKRAEVLFARKLVWPEDGLILQNIQARVRSPMIWMMANERSAILLSTGNRSEASLGYFTMDGDSSGGLAPLAGLSKTFLLSWLRWAHHSGCEDLGWKSDEGVAALAQVIAVEPTAELCPVEYDQSDEKDLMPYDVISALERHRLCDKKSKEECLAALRLDFPAISEVLLEIYVEDFDRLWCTSQWKRERLAMGFHLSEMNVDPQSGYRFPVLSPLKDKISY